MRSHPEGRREAVTGMQMGQAIAEALGLRSTRHIEIVIPLDGLCRVRCEYYPTEDEMGRVVEALREFNLMALPRIQVETPDEEEP